MIAAPQPHAPAGEAARPVTLGEAWALAARCLSHAETWRDLCRREAVEQTRAALALPETDSKKKSSLLAAAQCNAEAAVRWAREALVWEKLLALIDAAIGDPETLARLAALARQKRDAEAAAAREAEAIVAGEEQS